MPKSGTIVRAFHALQRGREWWRRAAARTRVASLLAVGGTAALLVFVIGRHGSTGEFEEYVVRRGHLEVSVPVAGVLVPCRAETYGGEIVGAEMKIVELVADGAQVERDALLIRFDEAPFRAALEEAGGKRQTAESEAEQAKQALRAAAASEKAALAEAEVGLARADLDLKTFVNGTAPLAVEQSAANLDRFRREAQEAELKLDGLKPFVEKGYISQEEFRAARMRAEQAASDLSLAEKQHRTLIAHTHPQLLAQKKADLEARREGVNNLRQRSEAQIAQARAAADLALARARDAARVEAEAQRKISLCQVLARSSGLAVYREIFDRSGQKRRVRVGDAVFSGQPVLDLPDLSCMQLEAKLQESDIHQVERNQKAEIRLDAFPNDVFSGIVMSLGGLTASERGDAKSFPLRLQISESDQRLRPGMTARAMISCGRVENALLVPVEALQIERDGRSCLVRTLSGTTRRRITIGKSNAYFAEVTSGLSERETVLIARP